MRARPTPRYSAAPLYYCPFYSAYLFFRARGACKLCGLVQLLVIQQLLFTNAFFMTDSVLLPFYYAYLFGLLQLLEGLLLPRYY